MGNDNKKQKESPNQSSRLVELAKENSQLFKDDMQTPHAKCRINHSYEVLPIDSIDYRNFLQHRFYEEEKRTASSNAVHEAIATLSGSIRFCGETEPVYVRVGSKDGKVFLDLCNEKREVVEISADGWTITKNPGVNFRRTQAMLPLPRPSDCGDINALRPFINIADDQWPLVESVLLDAVKPTGPYRCFCLNGTQNSGKSTVLRNIRNSIDPNKAVLRHLPRNCQDLLIAAQNSWYQAFDNVSHMSQAMSDNLCVMSTGGGQAYRRLHTNSEEVIFNIIRPFALCGIGDILTKPDLVSRSIIITLESFNTTITEKALNAGYVQARPDILGGICDGVSAALREIGNVECQTLGRMADADEWAIAAELGLGRSAGAFATAYRYNQQSASVMAIESSLVAGEIKKYLERNDQLEGTASHILDTLNFEVSETIRHSKGWPKTNIAFSNALRQIEPNLREININVERTRTKNERKITITKVVTLVTPSPEADSKAGFSREDDAGDEMTMLKGGMDWIDPENDF